MRRLTLLVPFVLLPACGSLSGLDAKSKFKCAAPEGVPCVSISGTYANVEAGNIPGLNPGAETRQYLANPPAASNPGAKSGDSAGPVGTATERAAAVQYRTPAPLPTAGAAAPGAAATTSPTQLNAPSSGTPLRTPERILRVWIAPFQDREGDLHDQRYVYVTVKPGEWTLEAARAAIRSQYQTVRPLSRPEREPTAARPLPPGTPVAPPAADTDVSGGHK